jgi:hypothetical protein
MAQICLVLPSMAFDELFPSCEPVPLELPLITDDVGDCIGDGKPDIEVVPPPEPTPRAGGEL